LLLYPTRGAVFTAPYFCLADCHFPPFFSTNVGTPVPPIPWFHFRKFFVASLKSDFFSLRFGGPDPSPPFFPFTRFASDTFPRAHGATPFLPLFSPQLQPSYFFCLPPPRTTHFRFFFQPPFLHVVVGSFLPPCLIRCLTAFARPNPVVVPFPHFQFFLKAYRLCQLRLPILAGLQISDLAPRPFPSSVCSGCNCPYFSFFFLLWF